MFELHKKTKKKINKALNGAVAVTTSMSMLLSTMTHAYAQSIIVDPSAPGTSFLQSGNLTPQINIANPQSGVSLNKFNDFNVGTKGLILNNSTTSGTSVIGANVTANPNLVSGPANVIVNEVIGTTPSSLTGTTEVFGQSAAVIIANPNGIGCNGCTFLNAKSSTLTTGKTNVSGSAVDLLTTKGTITIGPDGFNPGDQGGIFGRHVIVNGPIATTTSKAANNGLVISGGSQRVDLNFEAGRFYKSKSVPAPIVTVKESPFAIDASEAGSLKSGHVRIWGRETGLGVNTYGDIEARTIYANSKGDLFYKNINSVYHGTLNGQDVRQYGDVDIETAGSTGNYGWFRVSGKSFTLYDGRKIETAGDIRLNGSEFVVIAGEISGRDIEVTVTNGSLTNNGFLLADGELTVVASENVSQQREIASEYDVYTAPALRQYLEAYQTQLINGGAEADAAAEFIARAEAYELVSEYIEQGATSTATNVNFTATTGDIRNTGGAIAATNDVALTAGANIFNEYLALRSRLDAEDGCSSENCGYRTDFHAGEILAGNDLTLDANTIENRASDIAAANNITLTANLDIVNSLKQSDYTTSIATDTRTATSQTTCGKDCITTVTYAGSLDVATDETNVLSSARIASLFGNINIDAGRDFVSEGSEVFSGNNLDITAGRSVTLTSFTDAEDRFIQRTQTAYGCTGGERNQTCGPITSTSTIDETTLFTATSALIGRDVEINANNDIRLAGVRILASDDLNLKSDTGSVFGDPIPTSINNLKRDQKSIPFVKSGSLLAAVNGLKDLQSGADLKGAARSVGIQSFTSLIDDGHLNTLKTEVQASLNQLHTVSVAAINAHNTTVSNYHQTFRADLKEVTDLLNGSNAERTAAVQDEINTANAKHSSDVTAADNTYQAQLNANQAQYGHLLTTSVQRSRTIGWGKNASIQYYWVTVPNAYYVNLKNIADDQALATRNANYDTAETRRQLSIAQAMAAVSDAALAAQVTSLTNQFNSDFATFSSQKNALFDNLNTQINVVARNAERLIEQEAIQAELRSKAIQKGSVVEGAKSLSAAVTQPGVALSTKIAALENAFNSSQEPTHNLLKSTGQFDLNAENAVNLDSISIVTDQNLSINSFNNGNITLNRTRLDGRNINLTTGANIKAFGLTANALENANIKAGGDVYVSSYGHEYAVDDVADNIVGELSEKTWGIATGQTVISQELSKITTGRDLTIDAYNNAKVNGAKINSLGNISILANGNVDLLASQSVVEHHTGDARNGFDLYDITSHANDFTSDGDIKISSAEKLLFEATQLDAKGSIEVSAVDDLILSAAQDVYDFERRTYSSSLLRSKTTFSSQTKVTNKGTSLTADGDVTVRTQNGDLISAGTRFESREGNINLSATNGNIQAGTYTDVDTATYNSDSSALGGLIGGTVNSSTDRRFATGTKALAAVDLSLVSGNDTTLVGATLLAGRDLNLNVTGNLDVKAAISSERREFFESKLGAITATTETERLFRETAVNTTFQAGRGLVVNVGGQTQLTLYAEGGTPSPSAADVYPEELLALSNLILLNEDLANEYFYDKTTALSPAFIAAATIALTVGVGNILTAQQVGTLTQTTNGVTTLTASGKATAAFAASSIIGSANGAVSGDFDLGDILRDAAFAAGTSFLTASIDLRGAGQVAEAGDAATNASGTIAAADGARAAGEAAQRTFNILGDTPWGDGFQQALIGGTQLTPAAVLEGAFDAALSAGASSAVYGTDFREGLGNGIISNIVALGLADTQTEIGNADLGEGSIPHALLHGIAGCAAAELQGGNCGAGAAGAVAQSLFSGTLDGSPLNSVANTQRAQLFGAFAGFLFSGGEANNVQLASSIARSGFQNNYLNHTQWGQLASRVRACGDNESCIDTAYSDYRDLSQQQQDAYALCLVDGGDCSSHRAAIASVNTNTILGQFGFDVASLQQNADLANLLNIQIHDEYTNLTTNPSERNRLQEYHADNCDGLSSIACVAGYQSLRYIENERFLLSGGALTATAVVAIAGGGITIAAASNLISRATAACSGNAICVRTVISADLAGRTVDIQDCVINGGASCGTALIPVVTNGGGAFSGAENVAGSIRNVNPTQGLQNCVNCSIATDATLAGRPASALPSGPTSVIVLENYFGSKFGPALSKVNIENELISAGNGARGIVFGSRDNQVGHVFNVINQNGTVRFLDGQTGGSAVLEGFDSLHVMRTN